MSITDTFSINPIKPSMSHAERVYEYARRISHYSRVASDERAMSKQFNCSLVDENHAKCGERCGCSRREALVYQSLVKIGNPSYLDAYEPEGYCESCDEASKHYHAYRDAVSKKAAALRQLNNEMTKSEFFTTKGIA